MTFCWHGAVNKRTRPEMCALRRLAYAAAARQPAVLDDEETVEYAPGKRLLVKSLKHATYYRVLDVIKTAQITGYSRVYLDTRRIMQLNERQHKRLREKHGATVIGRMVYLNDDSN